MLEHYHIYLFRAAEAHSELPPTIIPIHSQIPGFPEAHAIEVPPELLSPSGPRPHGSLRDCIHIYHCRMLNKDGQLDRLPESFRHEREKHAVVVSGKLHLCEVVHKEVELNEDRLQTHVDHSAPTE